MLDSKSREKIRKALKGAGNIGLYAYQIKRKADLEESATEIGMYMPFLNGVKIEERSNKNKYVWDGGE